MDVKIPTLREAEAAGRLILFQQSIELERQLRLSGVGTNDGWNWEKCGRYVDNFHKEATRALEEGRDLLLRCHKMELAGCDMTRRPPDGPMSWQVGWNSPESTPLATRYRGSLRNISYRQHTHYEFYSRDWWNAMVDQGMKIGLVFPRSTPLCYRFGGNTNPVTFVDAMTLDVAREMDEVKSACIALLALDRFRLKTTQDVTVPWLVARFLWYDARKVHRTNALHEHEITSGTGRK